MLQRVAQSPELIAIQLDRFCKTNPGRLIHHLEFDIFGFSRGAAAARHFANEVLKPGGGLLREVLRPGQFGLASGFDWARDARINFIGLFDTVAAIVDPRRGDWSPSNHLNPGINLYLPAGCARKVVQLTARDERRWNFALNSVAPEHQEIELPGAHSDIGGGYPVLMEEHLLLTAPRAATIRPGQRLERSRVWQEATREAATLQMRGLPGDGELKPTAWSRHSMYPNRENTADQETLVGVTLRRRVRGELSASPCGPCANWRCSMGCHSTRFWMKIPAFPCLRACNPSPRRFLPIPKVPTFIWTRKKAATSGPTISIFPPTGRPATAC